MSTAHIQRAVRMAARALARAGLVGPFGHCSIRLDERSFVVCAARPMGLIGAGEEGTVVEVDKPLPDGVLGEVRMHQQIYKARPDVNAVCRFLSPNVMALAAMGCSPRARHGFGAYFHPAAPMWKDTALVRNDTAALGVAQVLGQAAAVVVGVNGALTVADTMEKAVALAYFLEDAARVELAVRAAGGTAHPSFESQAAAAERATWQGRIAERVWEHLTAGDPEASPPLKGPSMSDWIDDFHADVEALRLDAVLQHMCDDVEVAVGNNPVMKGHDAVRQGLGGLFSMLEGLKHTTVNNVESGPLTLREMKVEYLRKDGRRITVPVVGLFERRGALISKLRLYLDIAPVFAPAA